MTGGEWFDDLRNINLASNGLRTEQIAGNLKLAQASCMFMSEASCEGEQPQREAQDQLPDR